MTGGGTSFTATTTNGSSEIVTGYGEPFELFATSSYLVIPVGVSYNEPCTLVYDPAAGPLVYPDRELMLGWGTNPSSGAAGIQGWVLDTYLDPQYPGWEFNSFPLFFLGTEATMLPVVVPGQVNGVAIATTVVPEPGSLTFLVSALLGLAGAFYLRRRRAKA